MTENKIEELAMEKAVRWHMARYDLKGRTHIEYVNDMSYDKVDIYSGDFRKRVFFRIVRLKVNCDHRFLRF